MEPWSADWHNAIEAVKKDNPGTTYTETYNAYDATRAEPVIRQMLDGGAKVMLLSTFVLADAAKSVAADYPKVPMIVTAFGATQKPNLNDGTASYLEIGYSTCWLLTKLSPDGRSASSTPRARRSRPRSSRAAPSAAGGQPGLQVREAVSTNSFTDLQAAANRCRRFSIRGSSRST